jgi:hypothetical protein
MPPSRISEWSPGRMPTTSVRRPISLFEQSGDVGQSLLERGDRLAQSLLGLPAGVGLEDWPDQGGQQAVLVLAGVAEAVAEQVHAAALPGAAHQPRDRGLEPSWASETTSRTPARPARSAT